VLEEEDDDDDAWLPVLLGYDGPTTSLHRELRSRHDDDDCGELKAVAALEKASKNSHAKAWTMVCDVS
jgi:hypothetical protein